MRKSKIKRIELDKFTKPDDVEDIEVVIGDTSVLTISEVGDFINSVKPKPTENSENSSIIIPREKLAGKQKIKPKIANTANDIQIPKNVKKASSKKESTEKSSHNIKVKEKMKSGPIDPNASKVTQIESLGSEDEPKKKKVKIDPVTGKPIKKKAKIDPVTGKPIKKKVKVDPATGKPIKKKAKIDPTTGKPIKKKVKIDPVTGKPIKKKKHVEE